MTKTERDPRVRAARTAEPMAPGRGGPVASHTPTPSDVERVSRPDLQLELTWPGSEWDGVLPVPYNVVPFR